MDMNHRAQAERLLDLATDRDGDVVLSDKLTLAIIATAQVHATLARGEEKTSGVTSRDLQPSAFRKLLYTLGERWLEVADSCKPQAGGHDDLDDRYSNYRLIYLRAIRNLEHVLDTGTLPVELMTDEEAAAVGVIRDCE